MCNAARLSRSHVTDHAVRICLYVYYGGHCVFVIAVERQAYTLRGIEGFELSPPAVVRASGEFNSLVMELVQCTNPSHLDAVSVDIVAASVVLFTPLLAP